MALTLPNAEQWAASCQADGEFSSKLFSAVSVSYGATFIA